MMKTSTQASSPPTSKVKRIVSKLRRHSHSPPPSASKSSSTSPLSSPNASTTSSTRRLPHIGCHLPHSQRQSRRGSATEEDERAHEVELWNTAYDALKRDTTSAGLVTAYESIIAHALPDALRPDHHGNTNGLPQEGERRFELMSMIATSGLSREVSAESKNDSGDDDAREILVDARATISRMLEKQASAGIAWAGICSLTPLLLDPLLRHKELRCGLVHLTDTIPHFMALPRTLHPASWSSPEDFQRIQPHVRQTLLDLYRRILEYEMNIVCAAASAWNMAARNVVDWQGWEAMDDAVRAKDHELMADVKRYGTDELKALLKERRASKPKGGGRGGSLSGSTDAGDGR
ncbi:hypothetical protein FZEAL_8687 [Fusarium zealandicum]|uniref:NWD NACHT-NTPase N-terminal domain-containing protein n=1 Tax=Fusarium zealandicum TaxID=1053134 RepID=A0A8H4UEB4_9HYPO|nr:hypothetical protein FZEAL_8687 [Fusarium zealandicum]